MDNKSDKLIVHWWKDGNVNLKPEYDGVDFQIGSSSDTGYLRYDNTSGLEFAISPGGRK